jgi:hypothetical protein
LVATRGVGLKASADFLPRLFFASQLAVRAKESASAGDATQSADSRRNAQALRTLRQAGLTQEPSWVSRQRQVLTMALA